MMTDGHRDNSVGERKLIWDEENRLLAVDDNGFVSNYWYDADGERTVKTSGESDQVYVNGVFSGGSTNTAKFSLYVSPYLVANQGGRYTKHIYAGSQRIVSKVGDFASYGSDPRRIEYAGTNTDGLSVDYKSKYAAQQQVIKDNYKFFDVPYNGTDNDNYADGEGFCCNDGSMEAAVAEARKSQTRAVSRSFKDPDNYENLQFFYHSDHLGSSSFITNLDGEVVQHIEYVPFGEVFIEERNNVWNTPYLFNAKELDEETGMYYYGARYYEPRLSLWISTDPMQEKTPGCTSYAYCSNKPIIATDPDGNWAFLIPLVKGVVGGVIDISAQISVGMANDMTFSEAFDNVDWTSVGAATVLSATLSPGMSTGATVAVGTVIAADAAVDINTNGKVQTAFGVVGDEKAFSNVLIDAGTAVLPAKGVESATKSFTNAVASDLTAKSAATLTKGTKAELRQAVKTVNSEGFKTTAGAVADYTKGISVGQIKNEINELSLTPKRSIDSNLSVPRYTAPTDAIKVQAPILIPPNGPKKD